MSDDLNTPKISRLTVFPLKSLDPLEQRQVRISDGGVLKWDREYAIYNGPTEDPYNPDTASALGDGAYINGKRTAAIHRLRSSFDPEARMVTLRRQGETEAHTFDLDNPAKLNEWLSEYFGQPASVRRAPAGGHPDYRRHGISGPSVVSTATLQEVASWFDRLNTNEIRRRVRANIEIDGTPPFWEDRLYADQGEAVAFRVGDVQFNGVEPCERCIVPTRDPRSGNKHDGFRETFIRKRRETRPEWLDSTRFDHDFRLMVITDVPESEWGQTIQIGDSVEVFGTRPH
jgi:uncharacterized protein YcbX